MKEKYFDKALQFAIDAHRGQKRKWTTIPYILHPIEVCAIVATLSDDDEVLSAALLHDTVEDTDVTLEQIRDEFGDRVATLVQHETAPDDENLTWREKKSIQVERLAAAPIDSKIVALGDKLSNMQGIALDYRQVGDAVWSRFHAPNGKPDVEWYYRSLAKALSELSELAAYQGFVKLLGETFG